MLGSLSQVSSGLSSYPASLSSWLRSGERSLSLKLRCNTSGCPLAVTCMNKHGHLHTHECVHTKEIKLFLKSSHNSEQEAVYQGLHIHSSRRRSWGREMEAPKEQNGYKVSQDTRPPRIQGQPTNSEKERCTSSKPRAAYNSAVTGCGCKQIFPWNMDIDIDCRWVLFHQ